ncbi:uncharacterized protein MELLADRAFT_68674 [Melampsora larici-populina 98AG31]|uniref:Uncharacterized protein n=1 Tax=Melampsora larici-populina (strain 98AG31 / pathotype 3-4-7) TaxID=747676 RepID=F4S7P2_MELLP|nr:uncharacterized protein MELLADRAFT_68674 [Melampsora larici-populina 98AG31]EGF99358.1 hypothetical protein MELLADRAFT_68674 [Melampsora larici-populina 98AG31]
MSILSETDLLWAPNSKFGHIDELLGGYNLYWPGAHYVDIIGHARLNFAPQPGEALETMKYFADVGLVLSYQWLSQVTSNICLINQLSSTDYKHTKIFSIPNEYKPFVLAETGASYTRSKETGEPASGGASDYDIKYQWVQQLLSKEMAQAVPTLKAVSWFEVMKYENAAGDTPIKSEDFRLFMGEGKIGKDSASFVASTDF